MANKPKKIKLKPTRSGAQIYMSDSYAKDFLDSIDNLEPTDLEKLMDKKIDEKMYGSGKTPREVGRKKADIITDQIAEAVRISNKAKGGASGKAKGGAVRAMKLGGVASSSKKKMSSGGRAAIKGTEFKGTF